MNEDTPPFKIVCDNKVWLVINEHGHILFEDKKREKCERFLETRVKLWNGKII